MKSLKVQLALGLLFLIGVAAAIVLMQRGVLLRGEVARDLEKDFSYSLGAQYARNIIKQSVEVDKSSFLAGVADVLDRRELRLTEDEILRVQAQWQKKFDEQTVEKAKKNRAAGEAFLQEFRLKPDVKMTSTGLNYRILKEGRGHSPREGETVRVSYVGKLIDGSVFDQSPNGQALEMQLQNLIPAWIEALKMMKPGSKWEIALPAKLGYGDTIHPKIPPGSALVFEIELVGVKP